MANTDTKMIITLDRDAKRAMKDLTRAINRLANLKWDETNGASGVKRLTEPAEETPAFTLSPETIKKLTESVRPFLEM